MPVLRIEPAVINSIADMLTDDPEIFNDLGTKFRRSDLPPNKHPSPADSGPGQALPDNEITPPPKPKRSPNKKRRVEKREPAIRSPFNNQLGDGLMHDIDNMIIG